MLHGTVEFRPHVTVLYITSAQAFVSYNRLSTLKVSRIVVIPVITTVYIEVYKYILS